MATTIYSGSNDGYCFISGSNWVTIRDADTSTSVSNSITAYPYGIRASLATGRGGTNYAIWRSFLEFDVSGITHVPKSGTLEVRGHTFENASVIAVKGTQSASLATSDFDSIEGWDGSSSDGSGGGSNHTNVTNYGGLIINWDKDDYNSFDLTQQALVDIAGEATLKVCLLEYNFDLRDGTATTATLYSGLRFSEYSSTGSDPKLVIEEQENSVFFGCNF